MVQEGRELTTLRFTGARFSDHGLDLDVLPELTAYKRLLIETAKEVWRRRNPERLRLPRGFDTAVSIKFYELVAGSTEVPLIRNVDVSIAPPLPFDDELDEIDEAANIIDDAIDCAGRGEPAPSALPSSVVLMFDSFGQSLREDEEIVLRSRRRPMESHYHCRVRQRILDWVEPVYQDRVDITGEVRGADLDGESFAIRLEDGRKVRCPFDREQERTILDALGDHDSRRLRILGAAEFSQVDGALKRFVGVDSIAIVDPSKIVEVDPNSLLAMVADITARVPQQDWNIVPRDLAENLDHYLHGRERKN